MFSLQKKKKGKQKLQVLKTGFALFDKNHTHLKEYRVTMNSILFLLKREERYLPGHWWGAVMPGEVCPSGAYIVDKGVWLSGL